MRKILIKLGLVASFILIFILYSAPALASPPAPENEYAPAARIFPKIVYRPVISILATLLWWIFDYVMNKRTKINPKIKLLISFISEIALFISFIYIVLFSVWFMVMYIRSPMALKIARWNVDHVPFLYSQYTWARHPEAVYAAVLNTGVGMLSLASLILVFILWLLKWFITKKRRMVLLVPIIILPIFLIPNAYKKYTNSYMSVWHQMNQEKWDREIKQQNEFIKNHPGQLNLY